MMGAGTVVARGTMAADSERVKAIAEQRRALLRLLRHAMARGRGPIVGRNGGGTGEERSRGRVTEAVCSWEHQAMEHGSGGVRL